jgi:PleD family two-component response regulator
VVDDALRRADAALYRAKRSGRDRAVFAPSLDDGGDAHEATA